MNDFNWRKHWGCFQNKQFGWQLSICKYIHLKSKWQSGLIVVNFHFGVFSHYRAKQQDLSFWFKYFFFILKFSPLASGFAFHFLPLSFFPIQLCFICSFVPSIQTFVSLLLVVTLLVLFMCVLCFCSVSPYHSFYVHSPVVLLVFPDLHWFAFHVLFL